ncbi:hypothetical protein L2Y96_18150 [Luteibacter aegosomaticola]|uniref:hypothetical protein n=1 Tax=Luteibacter aegosomaticola TaxID=2911538 RepID=UPI001FFC0570|nr:hypothetical protein [Luteibacter aegosomaticola]UPG89301.1 hypothetical protein L2Y96_18150 [Luteibacter aegosomaticola]
MATTTWTSPRIQLTDTVYVDVSASADGVTLGESANHTIASDMHLSPRNARLLAIALLQGAEECEKAQAVQP